EDAVGVRSTAVPERPAHLPTWARPLEAPGERGVREAGQLPLLAALANAFGCGESFSAEPVDEIHAIRQPAPRNGPQRSDPDLAPGRRNHAFVEPWRTHAVE